ncbi:PREDICTED: coiled-coil domain-containing protein 110 [Gekko japonicus]|uniref:Coiled-coil domain-containing protein 110 n=1 Tax=Gekko japonicus TaxID=146911 RepID=A0ABM1KKE1_GEKJA|nr:PREDICTED: coiled-coil domain-containing protein 110 [Gekko japonicus]
MEATEVMTFRTDQECVHGGSRRWRRSEDKEKISPSVLVSEPGIQDAGTTALIGSTSTQSFQSIGSSNTEGFWASAGPSVSAGQLTVQKNGKTDKSASRRDGQGQAQSALKILQLQMESFQALRQQTLQSVSMVQSEISEILNKNIADVKHREFNPDPLLLTSTPIRVAMPRQCQEASLLKNQLHLDKRFMQCPETYPNKIFGDPVTDGSVPHHILSKCQSAGKAQAPDQTPREKAILAFKNDHNLKNPASNISSPPWVGFKTEASTALSEIKNYAGFKESMAFHTGKNGHVLESMSSSFRDMKAGNRKTPRHELPYTFEVQNTSTILYGKGNDSGYLSEQDPTGKAIGMSKEYFKSKRTSKLEDSVDGLHIAMVSLKENNQTAVQTHTESKKQNKELFAKGNMFEKLQVNFLPKTGEDKYFILEHTVEREKDNHLQLLDTKQEFQKEKVLESCGIDAGSDSYYKKSGLLEMSPKEPEPLTKKAVDLQSENLDLKKQIKTLTGIIQSLTEQNSKYQMQIKDLNDEKSNIQERLVKSDRDCKECIKEVKRLLKKCKESEQQKITLEEKQNQLYAQNQSIMQNLDDFQKKDQEAHESLAALTQEKGDLLVALGTLESQITPLQEECKVLEEKASQLENELEKKQKEIQQLKENEKTKQSNMEAALRMTQSLHEEKLELEKIVQESTDLRKILQKELEEAQRERANAEEKLLNECKNTRIETGVLETNLSNMKGECERLSALVGGLTEDNRGLKKELHEYKLEVAEYKARIRKLSEELLLMDNKMRSMENERDVLQFEVNRLHRNNGCLRDHVTALFNELHKPRSNSRSRRPDGDPADPTGICEEMSSFQHISVTYNSPECGRIAEIRRKLAEKEHHKVVRQHYHTVSVSCTTSVNRESSFHTTMQKKYSRLWTST